MNFELSLEDYTIILNALHYYKKVDKRGNFDSYDEERINDESDSIEIGVNILKKVDGKWKIVFISRIVKNQ